MDPETWIPIPLAQAAVGGFTAETARHTGCKPLEIETSDPGADDAAEGRTAEEEIQNIETNVSIPAAPMASSGGGEIELSTTA